MFSPFSAQSVRSKYQNNIGFICLEVTSYTQPHTENGYRQCISNNKSVSMGFSV